MASGSLMFCAIATIQAFYGLAQQSGSCVDKMKMAGCLVLSKRKWCTYKKDQMRTQCAKTCGFCAEVRECGDKSGGCSMMRSRGWCENHKVQMKTTCQKTCGLCPNIETNEVEITPVVMHSYGQGCVDTYGKKRCEYYAHIGMCTKNPKFKKLCHNTCVCNAKLPAKPINCQLSPYGCCWDQKTPKNDHIGSECPACKDDSGFEELCKKFKEDCQGSRGLGRSVRKYCRKTCDIC